VSQELVPCHCHRFLADAPLQVLFDFVDSLEHPPWRDFTLVNTFPRREFRASDASLSLAAADLAPQAALFVQPHDE
jgi:hypothetical protein